MSKKIATKFNVNDDHDISQPQNRIVVNRGCCVKYFSSLSTYLIVRMM